MKLNNTEFGAFELDEDIYLKVTNFRGRDVRLEVNIEMLEREEILPQINAFKSQMSMIYDLACASISNDLLSLYNNEWRNPQDAILSADEFLAEQWLQSVSIHDDSLILWFETNDLFAGHMIIASTPYEGKIDNLEFEVSL